MAATQAIFSITAYYRYFLRLSYLVWAFLVYDVWKALWFPNGFGIGLGTIVLAIKWSCWTAMSSAATPSATSPAARSTTSQNTRYVTSSTIASPASTGTAKKWACASLVSVGFFGHLRAPMLHGHLVRLEILLDRGISRGPEGRHPVTGQSSTACYRNSTRRRAPDIVELSPACGPGKSQTD